MEPDAPGAMRLGMAALTISVLGALAALSLGPFPQPDLPGPLEQLPHAVAYAAVTFVLLAVNDRRRDRGRPATVVVAVSMVLGGIALELGQSALDRDVEIADVVANCVGVATAVALSSLVRRSRHLGSARYRGVPNDTRR